MKKCPYCAEEIQDAAIKCKHCNEFLNTPTNQGGETTLPWYFRTSTIVIAIASIGPLALPLLWWRPKTSLSWKISLTLAVVILSWGLYQTTLKSLEIITDYYQLLNEL